MICVDSYICIVCVFILLQYFHIFIIQYSIILFYHIYKGDSLEDANFDRSVANQAISYLFVEELWIKEMVSELSSSTSTLFRKSDTSDTNNMLFMDKAVNNDIDYLIEATFQEFSKMCYRDGLHRCWFDLIILRDLYRDWGAKCGLPLHETIIKRIINAMTIMMSPIIPHWCEHIWLNVLNNKTSITEASWPVYTNYDKLLRKQILFFNNFMKNIRQSVLNTKTKPAPSTTNTANTKNVQIYISSKFDNKKEEILKFMQKQFIITEEGKNGFKTDFLKSMKDYIENNPNLKKDTKVSIIIINR